jgi:hypothetical protein
MHSLPGTSNVRFDIAITVLKIRCQQLKSTVLQNVLTTFPMLEFPQDMAVAIKA